MELITTFIILGSTIALFIWGKLRTDLVAILSLLALVITGILEPTEALAGFSNSTVIMLAGLFVVGGGILRTGLAGKAGNLLLRYSKNDEKRLFIILLVVVAIVGSFISNTGTVAILLPIVMSIALSMKLSSSKFLIPLAFAANLSGLMTLISTPTNLIVSQVLTDYGFEKMGFFTITPLGIVAFLTGLIYLYLTRNFLLPKESKRRQSSSQASNPKELIHQYHLEETLHRILVPTQSEIVNRTLKDLKIPLKYHIVVLKIERKVNDGLLLLPVISQEMPGPSTTIHANDVLYIQGTSMNVARFAMDFHLRIEPHIKQEKLVSKEIGITEVLLSPHSKFINHTVAESGFREKYNLNIIGINRSGKYILDDLTLVRLRFGDALLVQGTWNDIEFLSKDTSDVVVVGQPKEYASYATANGKAPIAAGILILMVLLMILEVFPTVVSVLIAAVLMVLTGCLRNMDDAYGQINWESILLIGAMLPMGNALEKTGGMALISEALIDLLGDLGPYGVLAGIYFVATIFGQFMSNTATAVLFSPIAMNAAIELGVSPYPFVIAVAAAAGMAFATPFSSPTNALVMTAGDYKFSDFFKVGLPLIFIMYVIMMIAIPLIYPF